MVCQASLAHPALVAMLSEAQPVSSSRAKALCSVSLRNFCSPMLQVAVGNQVALLSCWGSKVHKFPCFHMKTSIEKFRGSPCLYSPLAILGLVAFMAACMEIRVCRTQFLPPWGHMKEKKKVVSTWYLGNPAQTSSSLL